MPIFRSNGNRNPIPNENQSGVSVNVWLPEILIAVLLGSISFGAGVVVTNTHSQNANQVCSVGQSNTTSVTPAPMPRKD